MLEIVLLFSSHARLELHSNHNKAQNRAIISTNGPCCDLVRSIDRMSNRIAVAQTRSRVCGGPHTYIHPDITTSA